MYKKTLSENFGISESELEQQAKHSIEQATVKEYYNNLERWLPIVGNCVRHLQEALVQAAPNQTDVAYVEFLAMPL